MTMLKHIATQSARLAIFLAFAALMASCVHTEKDCENCPMRAGDLELNGFPISADGITPDTDDFVDTDIDTDTQTDGIDDLTLAELCTQWLTTCPQFMNEWGIYDTTRCVDVFNCVFDIYTVICDAYLYQLLYCIEQADFVDCQSCDDEISMLQAMCPYPEECLL